MEFLSPPAATEARDGCHVSHADVPSTLHNYPPLKATSSLSGYYVEHVVMIWMPMVAR